MFCWLISDFLPALDCSCMHLKLFCTSKTDFKSSMCYNYNKCRCQYYNGLLSKLLNNYSSQNSQKWIKLKNKTYVHFCTNNPESCLYYDRNISKIQNLGPIANWFMLTWRYGGGSPPSPPITGLWFSGQSPSKTSFNWLQELWRQFSGLLDGRQYAVWEAPGGVCSFKHNACPRT